MTCGSRLGSVRRVGQSSDASLFLSLRTLLFLVCLHAQTLVGDTVALTAAAANVTLLQSFDDIKAAMAAHLQEFILSHSLASFVHPPNTPAMIWWSSGAVFPVTRTVNGAVVEVNGTLSTIMSEFISDVQVVIASRRQDCTTNNAQIQFIVNNAAVIHDALAECTRLRFAKYHSDVAKFDGTVRHRAWHVCIFGCGVLPNLPLCDADPLYRDGNPVGSSGVCDRPDCPQGQ